MAVKKRAHGFREAVSALRSLDASKGLRFHTFSLQEERCGRLLIKNLGRRMTEDVAREELAALGVCVQGVMQFLSGRPDRGLEKDRKVTSHFIVTVARNPEVTKERSITQFCGHNVMVKNYTAPKGSLQCKCCQRFGHTQHKFSYAQRCVVCVEAHVSGEWSTSKEQLKGCGCGRNHTANYRSCRKGTRPSRSLQGGHLRGL